MKVSLCAWVLIIFGNLLNEEFMKFIFNIGAKLIVVKFHSKSLYNPIYLC